MNRQEALRKITLLRRISPDKGAYDFEAVSAARLADELMRRYVGAEPEARSVPIKTASSPTVLWERLLEEFGFRLSNFGGRCNAALNRNTRLLIRAEDQHWEIQQRSPEGWKTSSRGAGPPSLRDYLTRNTARRYTFTYEK